MRTVESDKCQCETTSVSFSVSVSDTDVRQTAPYILTHTHTTTEKHAHLHRCPTAVCQEQLFCCDTEHTLPITSHTQLLYTEVVDHSGIQIQRLLHQMLTHSSKHFRCTELSCSERTCSKMDAPTVCTQI